uniref:transposase n=1 Tax=Rubrobacter xylanophilus TaxID=49319 RepID=UPI001C641269
MEREAVYVALVITPLGERQILGFWLLPTESAPLWQGVLQELWERSLRRVLLFITDGLRIEETIRWVYPLAEWQRCVVHYVRNLLGMVSYASRKELGADLRAIFSAPAKEQALQRSLRAWPRSGARGVTRRWLSTWRSILRSALPAWPSRRAIAGASAPQGGLERFNQEIKRRTRVVRIFPNRGACLRLVTALAVEQSEEWVTGRRYLDMEQLKEWPSEEQAREEVVLTQQ